MNPAEKFADVETLARIAARLAGHNPDEHIEVRVGDVVAFSDLAWRYPDFMLCAEAAYELLRRGIGF